MSIKEKKEFGLFVIPIRFNNSLSVYTEYLEYISLLESHGYNYVFIGEHLTDDHEDIQSAMIFASAILARTKTIKVALSVLPLTHYHIPLLIKQLEDLYLLSNNRLLIGFSPGALDSDLVYLGFKPEDRYARFCRKLNQFNSLVDESSILKNIPKSQFFSTLLSPFPLNSYKLFQQGFSALSSNFTNISYHESHWQCLTAKNTKADTGSKWHIAYNLIPAFSDLSKTSQATIIKTLKYIYNKLNLNATKIMFPDEISVDSSTPLVIFEQMLVHHQTHSIDEVRQAAPDNSDIIVCNLFDCLDDVTYNQFIMSLPSRW